MRELSRTATPVTVNALGILAEQLHDLVNVVQAELAKETPDPSILRNYLRQVASSSIAAQAAI